MLRHRFRERAPVGGDRCLRPDVVHHACAPCERVLRARGVDADDEVGGAVPVGSLVEVDPVDEEHRLVDEATALRERDDLVVLADEVGPRVERVLSPDDQQLDLGVLGGQVLDRTDQLPDVEPGVKAPEPQDDEVVVRQLGAAHCADGGVRRLVGNAVGHDVDDVLSVGERVDPPGWRQSANRWRTT